MNSSMMDMSNHPHQAYDLIKTKTDQILNGAQSWMGDFLNTNAEKDALIENLMDQLRSEREAKTQLWRDLQAERKSRNNFQVECESHELNNQRIQQKINDASFVAVLIDGDGAKFADEFLQDPVEGAPRAAQTLKQAIRDYLRNEGSDMNSDDTPVFIRIYANVSGLGQSLRFSNVIQYDENMNVFAEVLTNSRTEVDFVNVGRGKENADSKIRKMLSHYHKNLSCRRIFLACCHDNGYLHDLREYSDKTEPGRIVLIETTQAEPGFLRLGFPVIGLSSVFRSQPLANETKRTSAVMPSANRQDFMNGHRSAAVVAAYTAAAALVPPSNGASPQLSTVHPQSQYPNQHAQTQMQMPTHTPVQTHTPVARSSIEAPPSSPPRAASVSEADSQGKPSRVNSTAAVPSSTSIISSGNGGVSISYATAGGTSEHQNIAVKPAKPPRPPKTIEYNSDGWRIDTPTAHPSQGPAQSTYQSKLAKILPSAFCNDHYLIGRCNRPGCERVHDMSLNQQEVSIHRYKARTSVCPRGPTCEDYDCYLSHHCLKDPKCTRGFSCKFYNTEHGNLHLNTEEKLRPWTRWTEGHTFPEKLFSFANS